MALVAAGWWSAPRLGLLTGDDRAAPTDAAGSSERAPTLLFATFDDRDPAAGASLVFVLGEGPGEGEATILFVPVSTVTDVPGHGLDRVSEAFAYGGAPLVGATVDNLLGLHADAVVTVSERGWGELVDRLGGITVDLPAAVSAEDADGSRSVRFPRGEQRLEGAAAADLLGLGVAGEGELDHLAQVRRVIEAIFSELADDAELVDRVFADEAPMLDAPLPPEAVHATFSAATRAHERGRLDSLVVPVSPLGTGDDRSLRIDRDRADPLVADRFPAAHSGEPIDGRRLQILNGNGRPGIGQEVAARVLPGGFRVVLTDNADRFDHEITRVIVHGDEPDQLDRARELVRLIGTGQVEVSRTPQSVVDITIVVGRDFLDLVDESEAAGR